MPNGALPSRFSLAYLAARHAGMLFLLASAGLAAGMAWRSLMQPVRYRSEAGADFTFSVPDRDSPSLWEDQIQRWQTILTSPRDRELLTANLRYAVKLSATSGEKLNVERLGSELALFAPYRDFPGLLFRNGFSNRLGPINTIGLRDIAFNMDYQSLAAIVSDLDPPDGEDWYSPAIATNYGSDLSHRMITRPGPADRYFSAFYQLHQNINRGRRALTPQEAWRTAAEEVADRLEREASTPGSGGFGHAARRELVREIAAIPALFANGLYRNSPLTVGTYEDSDEEPNIWRLRWQNASLDGIRRNGTGGEIEAAVSIELYPLTFPRDTSFTRVAPLAAVTMLAHMAAMTGSETDISPTVKPVSPDEPEVAIVSVVETPVMAQPSEPDAPITVVDEERERRRNDRIAAVEETIRRLRLDRETMGRRIAAAKMSEQALATEAEIARDRRDRLEERYQQALASLPQQQQANAAPAPNPQDDSLILAREELMDQLAVLLQTCTEEHPFVRQIRRELAAIESRLPKPPVPEPASSRHHTTKIDGYLVEWRNAQATVTALEERGRRAMRETENLTVRLAEIDQNISNGEQELYQLRKEAPVLTLPPAVLPETSEPDSVIPIRTAPQPPPAVPVFEKPLQSVLFSSIPSRLAVSRAAPSWLVPLLGMLLGLCLGLVLMAIREIRGGRFSTANEARHLVRLPLLAVLPAYDPLSFVSAAGAAIGDIYGQGPGKQTFIPVDIELAEPKPAARRSKIRPATRKRSYAPWLLGITFLLMAGYLSHAASKGLAQPATGFTGELPLPEPIYNDFTALAIAAEDMA